MRYIENFELREWVKESLRKTIFQKAHALAVQTGCEVLVKLKDATSAQDCPLYYATESLQNDYKGNGVRQEHGEMFVAGETGLPVFPMVDSATQSIEETADQSRTSIPADPLKESADGTSESAVPMQLSFTANDSTNASLEPKQESQMDNFTTQTTVDLQQDSSLSNVVVKLERMDDEELNDRLGISDLTEQASDEQASIGQFDFSAGIGDAGLDISPQPYPIMSPKPYQCGVCGKAFRSVQVLQKHTQTFHMRPQNINTGSRSRGRGRGHMYHSRPSAHRQPAQARFLCVMCNRSFRSPDLLQDHMTRSHMSHTSSVQLSTTTSQGSFDPSSAQTSEAPATATLQSIQQQQLQSPGSTFQSPATASPQFQISQTQNTPGGAFNMSAASTSSATFSSPSSSPMFRFQSSNRPSSSATGSPQTPSTSGASRVRGRWSHSPVKVHQDVPTSKLMLAILRTTGPVLTHIAVRRNGAPLFRKVTMDHFKLAASQLQAANLGTLIELRLRGGKPSIVFIKKPPAEVHDVLEASTGLLTPSEYTRRYNSPVLSSIPPTMRGQLMAHGLVPPEFFYKSKYE